MQNLSPSIVHHQQNQHLASQQEIQIAQHQQTPIVYSTTIPNQETSINQTAVVVSQGAQQSSQQVILHHQPHQAKPKTHFCQHCNKGFAAKHGLQLHNKRHPSGECTVRSHVCGECNRAFFQKNHLLLHQRQHQQLVQQETISDEKMNEEVSQENRSEIEVKMLVLKELIFF
jgi:hypothetical protein